jgi:hypothetical protein
VSGAACAGYRHRVTAPVSFFEFGLGHDGVDGGYGANWTDVDGSQDSIEFRNIEQIRW